MTTVLLASDVVGQAFYAALSYKLLKLFDILKTVGINRDTILLDTD